ncbi:MAG: CHASE2 domain-containing protein [Alphaproteobacteria bacterium]|nr:CHASE2 domain-containing protein [Alphaproteobacteria bacterium]
MAGERTAWSALGEWLRDLPAAVMGGGQWHAVLVLFALLLLRVWDPAPLEALRLKTFDQTQALFPISTTIGPVVIVDIDERSLAARGQWPWSRRDIAALVTKLGQLGTIAIGFDVVFAEPDRLSPLRLAEALPELDAASRARLAALADSDVAVAAAIAAGRVMLGEAPSPAANDARDSDDRPQPAIRGRDPAPYLFAFPAVAATVPVLRAAAGRGLLAIIPERDGVVRRLPAVARVGDGDAIVPVLPIELLRVATRQRTYIIKSGERGPEAIIVARTAIPVD